MFHYKCFTVNPIEENCYILWDDGSHEGAIVDCGASNKKEEEEISAFVQQQGIRLKYALQTHMHFDHCLGLEFVNTTYGLSPMCHPDDLPTYNGMPEMVLQWFNVDLSENLPKAIPDIRESSVLTIGDAAIQVLHTPGHTPGGVSYYIPQARLVLTGDTLFRMGIGRTDLPGGNYRHEMESITGKLFNLPPDTRILPGHGETSTIGEEKESNPYLV